MRKSLYAAAVLAGLVGSGGQVSAQDGVFTDSSGVWLFKAPSGGGMIAMNFGAPVAGAFTVRGLGYLTSFKSSVTVTNDAPVTLSFRSSGQITGTLPLEDETLTTAVGSMVVVGGGVNATNDKAFLRTKVTIGEKTRRVNLRGVRQVAPAVALAGSTSTGVVSGKGLSSRRLGVQLPVSERNAALGIAPYDPPPGTEQPILVGHPFYDLNAAGPASVNGSEVPNFGISGLVVSNNATGFYGRVTTTQYGAATISGNFSFDDRTFPDLPVFNATITPDSGKRFRIRATLQPIATPQN